MRAKDFFVRFLTDREIEDVAKQWREKLNSFCMTTSLDVKALFAKAGEFVGWPISIVSQSDDKMGADNAYVSEDKRTVYVRSSVVTAALAGEANAIFDAVHELAHIVLHRTPIKLARNADRYEKVAYLNDEDSAEHQANYFTRAFLILAEEAALYPYPDVLALECNIPFAQAQRRLIEITRLPDAKTQRECRKEAAWRNARKIPGDDAARYKFSRGSFKAEFEQYLRPSHHFGWFEDHGAVVTYLEHKCD